jgi:tRNA nucleotidyltransferase (CCA-adding enzyme)
MEVFINKELKRLVRLVTKKGGKVYAVKDFALSEVLKRFGFDSLASNLEVEIYGISHDDFKKILISLGGQKHGDGSFYFAGADIRIPTTPIEISAREKSLILDSFFLDLSNGEVIDLFEGLIDIQQGFIRYVDPDIFMKDTFNFFRAIQLASQLGFEIDKDILDLDWGFSLAKIKKEFLFLYWKDMLLNSSRPSIGMEYLYSTGLLKRLHLEIHDLVGVGQNPDWHQEGDAWAHTKLVVDAGARICRAHNLDEESALVLMLSCLCHDLGKPIVTKVVNGRISAKGHDQHGRLPTVKFLKTLGINGALAKKVSVLVSEHMFTHNSSFTKESVIALSRRIRPASIRDLVYLAEADCMGMINCQKDNNARYDLLGLAKELGLD